MKNTLTDVHNTLVEMLERLNDPDLDGKKLDIEIKRNTAACNVIAQMIALENLRLDAIKTADALLDRGAVNLPAYMEVLADAL